jgi:uncharacterized protein (DUF39 family)/CBS domain-containing protein
MCSSGVFLNFGHSDPPIKMQRIWLNDVEAYTGIAAVDAYIGATQLSETKGMKYGGAHVIQDFVERKPIELRAIAYGTDCYPAKEIQTIITIDEINQAIMVNPRNAYQRYRVAVNSSDRILYTYMGVLLPNYGNATYCGAGSLSPLCNDPDYETIGPGTRIFLGGASGYIIGEGTQHDPSQKMGTLMVAGNLKSMSSRFLRAATFHRYGTTLYLGIGIPIPVLNERIAEKCGVKNSEIFTEVIDYGVPRRSRPVVAKVSYEDLISGEIEVDGKIVPASPLSSFKNAREIATILKNLIQRGEFFLSKPSEQLPKDRIFRPMKQIREKPQVKDVMRRDVVTVEEGASVKDAARIIMKGQFTHLPVVSSSGQLRGIITAWDISKGVAIGKWEDLEEIMTKKVITADPDEPIDITARKLEKYNISALPVVDKDRKVIGIIRSEDLSRLVIR